MCKRICARALLSRWLRSPCEEAPSLLLERASSLDVLLLNASTACLRGLILTWDAIKGFRCVCEVTFIPGTSRHLHKGFIWSSVMFVFSSRQLFRMPAYITFIFCRMGVQAAVLILILFLISRCQTRCSPPVVSPTPPPPLLHLQNTNTKCSYLFSSLFFYFFPFFLPLSFLCIFGHICMFVRSVSWPRMCLAR